MIPRYKLEKLPRSPRLRKLCRIFTGAELGINADSGGVEPGYFAGLLELLMNDSAFSPAALETFREAYGIFRSRANHAGGIDTGGYGAGNFFSGEFRRLINQVRHILLTEIGQAPADWDLLDSGGRLDPSRRQVFSGLAVYLEDIRSPFNVGAMIRSAEAFGVERLYLSSFCADPRHPRALRTAMGCTDVLPWERLDFEPFAPDSEPLLPGPFFALETGGIDIDVFSFPRRGIMIAGSEELGVSPRALAAADASLGRVSIPLYGAKGSLNVSTAFGIALSAWTARLTHID